MDLKPHKTLGVAVFIAALFLGLSTTPRENFNTLILYYFLLFGVMIILTFKWEINIKQLLIMGVAARLPFFFSPPLLSDDLYRFYWDAKLIIQGISPFKNTPSFLFSELDLHKKEWLYANLNSPRYYSVYPSLNQVLFTVPTLLSNSFSSFILLMKIQFMAFDLLGFYFLNKIAKHLDRSPKWITLYFLHPLLILEGMGNFHFETIMVALMAGAAYFMLKNKPYSAILLYGSSILTKLMTLLWIPLFIPWRNLFLKKNLLRSTTLTILLSIGLIPIIVSISSTSFSNSFGLYFQKFEFNASIYYLTSFIGEYFIGYNPIAIVGKVLPVISIILIGWITWEFQKKKLALADAMIYIFFSYYLLATTIHPWYLILGIPLLVFTNNKALITWSLTVIFSYGFYSLKSTFWLWLEYLPVFFLLFQRLLNRKFYAK